MLRKFVVLFFVLFAIQVDALQDRNERKSIKIPAKKIEKKEGIEFIYPPKYMMNDNAAMIAWATFLKYKSNHDINFEPNPRLTI